MSLDADELERRLREMVAAVPKWDGPPLPPQLRADIAEEARDDQYLLRTDDRYRRYVSLLLEASTPEEMNAAYETVYEEEGT